VVHAAPDVTLEQDLSRRDLTINAMAQDAQGRIIDPHGGQRDIQARVLRHVTDAFREDPVRILRVARFAARFSNFTVAPETMALMREMVQHGEVDALVGERVWQELSRGLMATQPTRMIDVLADAGAWQRLFPQHPPLGQALALSAAVDTSLAVRAACVFADDAAAHVTDAVAQPQNHEPWTLSPWILPADVREVIELTRSLRLQLHAVTGWTVPQCLACLLHSDAIRRPGRLREALDALTFMATAWASSQEASGTQDPTRIIQSSSALAAVDRLRQQLQQLLTVDTSTASAQALAQGLRGPAVGEFIRRVQEAALAGT
jgi:tRNA nucleotidyltransferase (CCA-adding enzyme)